MIASKLPQMYTNYKNSSTGNLALASFALSFLGSLTRLGTVLFETDDYLYKLQFIISTLLNATLLGQFFLYWNNSCISKKKNNNDAEKKE